MRPVVDAFADDNPQDVAPCSLVAVGRYAPSSLHLTNADLHAARRRRERGEEIVGYARELQRPVHLACSQTELGSEAVGQRALVAAADKGQRTLERVPIQVRYVRQPDDEVRVQPRFALTGRWISIGS